MGVSGRIWRLPAEHTEVESRAKTLAFFGLAEDALVDAPAYAGRQSVHAELYPEERAWLVALTQAAGLTRQGSPARMVRAFVRAAIVHRNLLPVHAEIDTSALKWLHDHVDQPLAERLTPWLDALPIEVLAELRSAIDSALTRRDGL
jgi:hypothetical protein